MGLTIAYLNQKWTHFEYEYVTDIRYSIITYMLTYIFKNDISLYWVLIVPEDIL